MFAEAEEAFRKFWRRLDRSEWAIRHLDISVSEGSAEEPGLLLIQIDGLSRQELENAVAKGRMPFLAKLQSRNRYELRTFYSGLPSTTPAVQAELFYGVKTAVPAFSFMDRASGEVVSMFDSERVKSCEKQFATHGEGLLTGGSSWSNIYSGGAAEAESRFCLSTFGKIPSFGGNHPFSRIVFALLQLPVIIRIVGLFLIEVVLGFWDMIWGLIHGQRIDLELVMFLSRMFVGVVIRELVRVGVKLDLARGLPIIHMNFLGYDEMSHRRGPDSGFAHWSLGGIDQTIADFYGKAAQSHRRDYQVWIFSDHGQEKCRSFETEFSGGIKRVVSECISPTLLSTNPSQRFRLGRPFSRRLYEWEKRRRKKSENGAEPFALAAMGPVGHIYFSEPVGDAKRRELARCLVKQGKIPAVLHLNSDASVSWHDAKGTADDPAGIADRLASYPATLRSEIVEDLLALCRHENAGDLMMLGCSGSGESWSFAPEKGSHAGLGPTEIGGFLLTPPGTRLPAGSEDFVRPSGLRDAARHLLGRDPIESPPAIALRESHLRVMTYNVHGCRGMDGRVSPRRIARIIAEQNPDIVALQELDHGRVRSRAEDQATAIAELLGYHVIFCPTVISGTERYGHAVLSRMPLEAIKAAELPNNPKGVWPEKRGALWSQVSFHNFEINVLTTHLGLSANERHAQMTALLGPDWAGPILSKEPVILCGDFNCVPGGPSHRLATAKLQDVVGNRKLNTFSSLRSFVRLDHIFTSSHFTVEHVAVIRNHLTRISSDHLPLVADLLVAVEDETLVPSAEAVGLQV